MNTFSIKEVIAHSWNTVWKRPFFFAGVMVLCFIIQLVLGSIENATNGSFLELIAGIFSFVVSVFMSMGLLNIALKTDADVMSPRFSDLWYPKKFWNFLGANILTALAIIVGLVLIIVPGVIATLALGFSNLVVMTKGLKPVEALKESYRITKGKWLKLLGFYIVLALINVVGMLLIGIGLLITVPMTMISMVYVYHKLQGGAHAPTQGAPAPAPAV